MMHYAGCCVGSHGRRVNRSAGYVKPPAQRVPNPAISPTYGQICRVSIRFQDHNAGQSSGFDPLGDRSSMGRKTDSSPLSLIS